MHKAILRKKDRMIMEKRKN